MEVEEIVAALDLQPHPEGGWFCSSYRPALDGRPPITAIYFLLVEGNPSAWHRLDATEIWHHYAGEAVVLRRATADGAVEREVLGPDVTAGERPQAVIEPGTWQSAATAGRWSLCGCTVSPGFVWEGFELAPEGWEP